MTQQSGRSRSTSNLNLNSGISELSMSLRKKSKMALLQVFQPGGRKTDEDASDDQQQQRIRSNSGFVDYLKGKKTRNNNSVSSAGFLDAAQFDLPDDKLPKTKSGYHTWSLRRTTTPNSNNSGFHSPSKGSPKTPKKFSSFGTLGRSKKGKRSGFTSSTFRPTEETAEEVLPRTKQRTPESLIGLFSSGQEPDSEYVEIRCQDSRNNGSNRNSLGNDDSGDYDEISTGSSEEKASDLSRNASNCSRNSTSHMPLSPIRPPKTPSSKERSSPNLFRRINDTISPRQRRRARAKMAADSSRASTSEEEEEMMRSMDDSDITKSGGPEDVFDTWDGRNAVTLPRKPKKVADSYDSVASDAKEGNSKSKFKRPSIIRPQSMMINRPAQYSGPHSGYTGGPAKSNARPISNAVNLKVSSSDLYGNNNKSNRSSYYDEEEDGTPPNSYVSSAKDLTSGSMESLDEASDNLEYDNDPDLMLKPDEPDSWSVTADKKVLKKMSKKETKRQDNIYEIIQTERNYLTTLKIMQRIYARGMSKELHLDQTQIERFFPLIDEHVEFVAQFVQKLTERQADKKVVERIGDVLTSQWAGDSGDTMRRLLGEFCCRHNEITSLYKEHMKSDKKFNTFIRKCEKIPHTRRQGIPECALLVTQRITKYPLMVQALLENSKEKDHKEEYEDLTRALELSKEIAKNIDDQVQDYERQRQLYDIYDRTETKSATSYKDGRKFDRKDLLRRNRKLLYSCNSVQLKIARKFTDVQLLVLSDCIVFLLESGGKYSFPSGQPAVVSLQNLLVREVASSDEKGLFLLSPGSQQMYEMKTSTSDECKTLTQKTRVAVGNCPDEDEGIPSEDEEERRIHELQLAKVRKLISQLEHKDREINRLLADKMGVFQALAESVDRGNPTTRNHYSYPSFVVSSEDDLSNAKQSVPACAPTLQKALEQVTKLSNAIYGAGGLSRHPSSVGEHDSGTTTTPSLPKRSDTFGGFDNGKEPPSPRTKYMNTSQSDSRLKELENSSVSESSKRDSGLVDLDITVGRTDSQSSIPKAWPPSNNSSSHNPSPTASQPPDEEFPLLPPTTDQVTALTQLSNLFNSFLSVASQKDTHMERLHLQLMQDRGSITKKRSGTLADAEMKRNQLKQQEQMDDLRRQQQQFKSEREHFNRTNERFQRSIDRERQEMDDEKRQILRSKKEIDERLEEVTRLKDEQQKELTRLRELQRRSQNEMHTSASSSAISSSASNRNNSSNNLDTIDSKLSLDAAGAKSSSSALSGSKSFSSLHVSNSAANADPSGKPPASPTYASAADYPRTFPGMKRDSASIVPNPGAGHHPLPIHLQYSATNQVTALQAPKPQTLPLKIATQGKPEKHGVHQIIPSKLSKLASGGQSSGHQHPSSKKLHIV